MFSGKRFNLLKQRMVGRGEAEPMELKALKKEVFQLKAELVKTRKGVQSWLDGARELGFSSQRMSVILGKAGVQQDNIGSAITEQLVNDLSKDSTVGRICATVIQCIEEKIKLFAKLKSEAAMADEMRLHMNRLKKRLADYQRKNEAAMAARLQREYDEAQQSYKGAEAELTGKLQFLKGSTQGKGATALVMPELHAFVQLQKRFFISCAGAYPSQSAVEKQESGILLTAMQLFTDKLDKAGKSYREVTCPGQVPGNPPASSMATATPMQGTNPSQQGDSTPVQPESFVDASAVSPPSTKIIQLSDDPETSPVMGRILYSYEPTQQDELQLVEGDCIRVLSQNPDGWWQGQLDSGKSGLFPANYCEIIEDCGVGTC